MIKRPWNCVSRNNNVKATPEMTRILVPPIKKKTNISELEKKRTGERGRNVKHTPQLISSSTKMPSYDFLRSPRGDS
jgi:hypothetical protein